MSKNNMKSPEEKEIIVKRYLNGESTTKLADEFNVSRRRIYYWVKDYEEKGLDGLISNTGKASKHHKNMGLYLRKPKSREEELEIELMKKDIEIARLKKGYNVKGVGQEKGIHYYIQQEYKIINEYKDIYSIKLLCEYMSVSRSGYYKWKYRQEHPTTKMISRQSDIDLIKEIHKKHPSHGYRWINAYARNKYGVVWSNNHVHLCCKYENIKSQGKHYQWKKPDEEHEKFNNLVWNGWKYLSRPYEVIVSDMTAFNVKGVYYELTLYFDAWNKEIVGYGLVSRKGDTKSYYDGLNQVLSKIKEEQIKEPIILHTDQGAVYSSTSYNNLLNEFNIQRSMSRAGTPTDNPVNESLNGWIKEELFIDFDLKHSNDVPNLIKLYIDYYNYERPSYALNYKTPIQYKIESGF